MVESLISIFLWFLITPLDLSIAEHRELTSNHMVHVIKKLRSHSETLQIHCTSKDDDLGYHNLTTNQDFDWSFSFQALAQDVTANVQDNPALALQHQGGDSAAAMRTHSFMGPS
ncbi:hypothetical protein BC332_13096 [Capsicum chinense]|nr:hypothetical protein BC332_13096 [Capsicum chinense]